MYNIHIELADVMNLESPSGRLVHHNCELLDTMVYENGRQMTAFADYHVVIPRTLLHYLPKQLSSALPSLGEVLHDQPASAYGLG